MRKFFTALFFLCGIPVLLYGQPLAGEAAQNVYEASMPNIVHPSPQAMAFMRYGEIPVSLSSGVPEISIPIYTIKANGLEFSIAISYHASGIKVSDISGTVGLGWVLNAGGMIAQTVYGWNDHSGTYAHHRLDSIPFKTAAGADMLLRNEYESNVSGNCQINRMWYGCFTPYSATGENFANETRNTISDRYSFNFCGRTGVFRYNLATDKYETIPYSPLKIEKKAHWNDGFIITDENGIKWSFGSRNNAASIAETKNQNLPPTLDLSAKEYHLTSVQFPGVNDSISLTYSYGSFYSVNHFSESIFTGKEPEYKTNDTHIKNITNKQTYTNQPTTSPLVLLESIVWRNDTIVFSYDRSVQSLMKEDLNSISIRSGGNEIRNVQFTQSYSNERMFLDSIVINGEEYSFQYNSVSSFPSYGKANCDVTDFWGYQNRACTTKTVPFNWSVASAIGPTFNRTYSDIKETKTTYSQAGILTQITYPTKGRTVFEYEQNQALGVYQALRNSNISPDDSGGIGGGDGPGLGGGGHNQDDPPIAQAGHNFWPFDPFDSIPPPSTDSLPPPSQEEPFGGLRIKKITNYDNLGGVTWKKYEYEGGRTKKISPEHFCETKSFYYMQNTDGPEALSTLWLTIPNELGSMSTRFPLTEFGGPHAFYHKVTEYTGKGNISEGKVEYFHEIDTNYTGYNCVYNCFRYCDKGAISPLLVNKKEYMYEQGSYTLKRETKNKYNKVNKGSFITGVEVSHNLEFSPGLFSFSEPPTGQAYFKFYDAYYNNGFRFDNIYAIRDFMRLDSTETVEYLDQGVFSTTVNYGYNNRLLSPNQTTTQTSTGGTYIEIIAHPFNKNEFVYADMETQNILAPVVSKSAELWNSTPTVAIPQIAVIDYNYRKDGNLFVIDNVAAAKGNAALETRIRYHNYDKYGNPLYITKDSTINVVYLWSYKGKYPVAEIKNANYQQVVSILTNNFITTLLDAALPSTDTMNQIEALRNNSNLSEAQVTTFYYKQGVGVSQIIDPNGMKITYEYDAVGRLQAIKDDDGNILEHHSYHYAQ